MKKRILLLILAAVILLSACASEPVITADDLFTAQQKGYNLGIIEKEAAVKMAALQEEKLLDSIAALEKEISENNDAITALENDIESKDAEINALQAEVDKLNADIDLLLATPAPTPSPTPRPTAAPTPRPTSTAIAPVVALSTPAPTPKPIQYIGNKNTKKFHRTSCYTLPDEKNRVYFNSRDYAINSGYDPCKNCNP